LNISIVYVYRIIFGVKMEIYFYGEYIEYFGMNLKI